MEAKLRVLASGSSGNAYFVAFGHTRVLIDAGVGIRRLRRDLDEIGESVADLTAVLVTHEHTDHTNGLAALRDRNPHVPILTTAGTAKELVRRHDVLAKHPPLVSRSALHLDDVRVVPFSVDHDAAEPVGFRFDWGDFAIGVATDLGTATPLVESMLAGCRVLVLEANHDEDLLRRGPYPVFLQQRVASARGHLSNRQSASLLASVAGPTLEYVLLAHLSGKNNTPDLAVAAVSAELDRRSDATVEIARQALAGPLLSFDVAPCPLPDLPYMRASGAGPTQTPLLQPRLLD